MDFLHDPMFPCAIACDQCDCTDFTPNAFKAGCNNCFHEHPPASDAASADEETPREHHLQTPHQTEEIPLRASPSPRHAKGLGFDPTKLMPGKAFKKSPSPETLGEPPQPPDSDSEPDSPSQPAPPSPQPLPPSQPAPPSPAQGSGGTPPGDCDECECTFAEFVPDPFKPGKCRECFHKHVLPLPSKGGEEAPPRDPPKARRKSVGFKPSSLAPKRESNTGFKTVSARPKKGGGKIGVSDAVAGLMFGNPLAKRDVRGKVRSASPVEGAKCCQCCALRVSPFAVARACWTYARARVGLALCGNVFEFLYFIVVCISLYLVLRLQVHLVFPVGLARAVELSRLWQRYIRFMRWPNSTGEASSSFNLIFLSDVFNEAIAWRLV